MFKQKSTKLNNSELLDKTINEIDKTIDTVETKINNELVSMINIENKGTQTDFQIESQIESLNKSSSNESLEYRLTKLNLKLNMISLGLSFVVLTTGILLYNRFQENKIITFFDKFYKNTVIEIIDRNVNSIRPRCVIKFEDRY